MTFYRLLIALAVIAVWGFSAAPLRAEWNLDAPLRPVPYDAATNLRALVEQNLDDPDLWPLVLRLNGIGSIDQLKPGAVLMMPVEQVAAVNAAIGLALDAIRKATAEGARLFAPDQIAAAIENRDLAVGNRAEGAWAEAVRHAEVATTSAGEALEISLGQRNRAAEALVTDVQGSVEGRSPAQSTWSGRKLNDALVENERVRTLSASSAQVSFRDLSRLRLNPNSNATIQTMRSDPLTGGEVTKVNLVSGDFYALLNQLSERTSFQVEVDGRETTTKSADFWVKNDDEGARFANYDTATLDVATKDGSVSLGRNEGAVVNNDGEASLTDVLTRPSLDGPGDGDVVFGVEANLTWSSVEDAVGYWLEVAADSGFDQMKATEWDIPQTAFTVKGLEPGRYYWRIASLDGFGLPGEWSLARSFDLTPDTSPPYLSVSSPRDGESFASAAVQLRGETEPGARVVLDGAPVAVEADGSFVADLSATTGDNSFRLEAQDAAGNRAERTIAFVVRPAELLSIALDASLTRDPDGTLLTQTDELALRASTDATPGASVRLVGPAGEAVAGAVVDTGGAVSLVAPAVDQAVAYRLEVLSPRGDVEGQLALSVRRDNAPPVIAFERPPPQLTAETVLRLSGNADDAVEVALDGQPVELANGVFTVERSLAPGRNVFELVARDRVGNVALRSLVVTRDNDAPEVLSARLERPKGDDGPIEITAEVREEGGLRPIGSFEIDVDGIRQSGLLRCDPVANLCRATLPAQDGTIGLVGVAVEDYAGNRSADVTK